MTTQRTILVVEDDSSIREMIKMLLEQYEYTVLEAKNYAEALQKSRSNLFHLVLLDWMLPGGSGIQFIKKLKEDKKTSTIPIIMVTAKQREDDHIMGLDSGADDFIVKPFSNKQLLARVNALFRRSYPEDTNTLTFEGVIINTQSRQVIANNCPIALGPTEYKLLHFLVSNPNHVYTRGQLIDHIWGYDSYIDDRTIDVHIGRLRKQLEATGHHNLVQTVRGTGYRLSGTIQK